MHPALCKFERILLMQTNFQIASFLYMQNWLWNDYALHIGSIGTWFTQRKTIWKWEEGGQRINQMHEQWQLCRSKCARSIDYVYGTGKRSEPHSMHFAIDNAYKDRHLHCRTTDRRQVHSHRREFNGNHWMCWDRLWKFKSLKHLMFILKTINCVFSCIKRV